MDHSDSTEDVPYIAERLIAVMGESGLKEDVMVILPGSMKAVFISNGRVVSNKDYAPERTEEVMALIRSQSLIEISNSSPSPRLLDNLRGSELRALSKVAFIDDIKQVGFLDTVECKVPHAQRGMAKMKGPKPRKLR